MNVIARLRMSAKIVGFTSALHFSAGASCPIRDIRALLVPHLLFLSILHHIRKPRPETSRHMSTDS
jgi:hypothetical protein